jgi:hypothetical protein
MPQFCAYLKSALESSLSAVHPFYLEMAESYQIKREEKVKHELTRKGTQIEPRIIEYTMQILDQDDQRRQNIANADEERVRDARNQWKKIWKEQRLFSGLWKDPDVCMQFDTRFTETKMKFEELREMVTNRRFSFRVAKNETKSRARPYLKIKLTEPAHALEDAAKIRERRLPQTQMANPINAKYINHVKRTGLTTRLLPLPTLNKLKETVAVIDSQHLAHDFCRHLGKYQTSL